MKKIIISLLFTISLSACLSNMKATIPPGATVCHKDPDCFEGQYCGFKWGYNGAHCIGTPTSDYKNLPPIPPMNH